MSRFSRTVINGKTRRASARSRCLPRITRCVGQPSIRAPSKATVPDRGATSPKMTFIVVDLPLALPPSSETMLPSPTASVRSKCACTAP